MNAERAVKRITFTPNEAKPARRFKYTCLSGTKTKSLSFLAFQHRSDRWPRKQLSCPERIEGAGGQIHCKIRGQHSSRHIWLRHVQNLRGSFPFNACALAAVRDSNRKTFFEIRSNAGDKDTTRVDADKALDAVFDTDFRFRLDNPILDDHGIFYPLVLYNHFVLEMTLAPALQVVKGSDALKLVYRLTKIQMEYETIHNTTLADKETTITSSGKAFAFDQIMREEIMTCNNKDSMLNNRVNPQRRSLKGILLLLIEPYIAGARDSEKYINPDITKVSVTVNGSPNKIYNNGIEAQDMWQENSRYFHPKDVTSKMYPTRFYTDNKFGLFIDLRSMLDTPLHGSGVRLVNTKDGVFLEIDRKKSSSGNVNCHDFTVRDAQMNIMDKQL